MGSSTTRATSRAALCKPIDSLRIQTGPFECPIGPNFGAGAAVVLMDARNGRPHPVATTILRVSSQASPRVQESFGLSYKRGYVLLHEHVRVPKGLTLPK